MADSILTSPGDSGESDFPLTGAWVAPPLPVFRTQPTKIYISGGEAMALAVACYRSAQVEPSSILKEYYTQQCRLFTRLSGEPGFDPTVEPVAEGGDG